METVGRALAAFAAPIGRWADKAAEAEGRRAGAIAGLDPEFRPRRAGTIRADAFDQAGIQTYADQLDLQLREDAARITDAHRASPKGVAAAFDALDREYRTGHVFQEVMPAYQATLGRLRLSAVRQATRAVAAEANAARKAAFETDLDQRLRDLGRNAYFLGLDGAADEAIAGEMTGLASQLEARGADGARLRSEAEAARIMRRAELAVATARVQGAFERTEGIEARQAFLEEFETAYREGEGPMAVFDVEDFQRQKAAMEADIKRDLGGVRDLVDDDVASLRETGVGVPVDRALAVSALGEDGVSRWLDEREDAATYFATTRDFAALPQDVIEQRVAALEPEAGSEGFDRQAKLHGDAASAADSALKERARDPAAAVLELPQVRAAFDAAERSDDPGALEAAVDVSLAAQTKIGIPAYARRPITIAEARALALPIRAEAWRTGRDDVSREERAAVEGVLQTVTDRYGRHADEVLRHVVEETSKDRRMGPLFSSLLRRMSDGAAPNAADLSQAEILTEVADAGRASRDVEVPAEIAAKRARAANVGFAYARGRAEGIPPREAAEWPVPSMGAIRALVNEPSRAAEFDRKYGPGAANRLLGQP
jgi:hypothetical protein